MSGKWNDHAICRFRRGGREGTPSRPPRFATANTGRIEPAANCGSGRLPQIELNRVGLRR